MRCNLYLLIRELITNTWRRPWPFTTNIVTWHHRARDHTPSDFLQKLHCKWVCISNRCRDNGLQTYWVMIWPFKVMWRHSIRLTESLSQSFSRYLASDLKFSQTKSSLRMRDITWYAKFKYIFSFLTPNLPIIHYATFIGLRWRIRIVLSRN